MTKPDGALPFVEALDTLRLMRAAILALLDELPLHPAAASRAHRALKDMDDGRLPC
jgi:hypothetical protein